MRALARRALRPWIATVAAVTLTTALGPTALASHVHLEAAIPEGLVVGQMAHIPVTLEDAQGAPLPGTRVVFYLHVVFAGVEGEAEIGSAVTDDEGRAVLAYTPRLAGQHQLRIEYTTLVEGQIEILDTVFDVSGGEQLYRSAAAVEIPGAGSGLLMAVLTTVWSILLWVALRLVAIARAGRVERSAGPGPR